MRVRLDVSYDGTDFSGWAIQRDRRTVQGVLTEGLTRVLRVPADLTVAGRTDAGVHATGQVAHLDVPADVWEALHDSLVRRLAGVLPGDVRVRAARAVPPQFDARFGALRRWYEYAFTDAPWGAEPLQRRDTLRWPRRLELRAMEQAAAGLVGEHDFAAFCRRRDGASTVRELQEMAFYRRSEHVHVVRLVADAFCHSMVRSLVGALLAVGEGRRPPSWPAELLRRPVRAGDVTVAPPHGLTLVQVDYPPDADLAARDDQTRQLRVPPTLQTQEQYVRQVVETSLIARHGGEVELLPFEADGDRVFGTVHVTYRGRRYAYRRVIWPLAHRSPGVGAELFITALEELVLSTRHAQRPDDPGDGTRVDL